jgi:nuclear RNA export factor
LIKRSRLTKDTLIISVRADDVEPFGKINGFQFTSKHGPQKLNIMGPGIRSKSPKDAVAPTNEGSSEIAEKVKGFLERRYDAGQKLLNLSSIAEDEVMSAIGMFDSTTTQSKFFPVLMTIIERQLKTADERREAIQSITLSNNNLPHLGIVKDLAITLPRIKNLDLSGNKLSSTNDLVSFKQRLRDLDYLILSGNPLETSQPGWEQEIIGWFPRLRILNGQTVRTDEQIARLDAPKQTPTPSTQNVWLDGDKIAQNFLVEFLQGFDNDRNALIQKYYDNTSVFTMSVNARAKGGAGNQHDRTPWDSYLPLSRNLNFIKGVRSRFGRKHRGLEQIQKAWTAIPPTRHPPLDTNKYSMDCQPQPGLPDPSGQFSGGVTGLMVTLHGEYEEHRTAKGANEVVRRAFDRVFILGPGGPSGVRVISDSCGMRAAGGVAAWIPQNVAPTATAQGTTTTPAPAPAAAPSLTPEQEAMVMEVHQHTRLTLEMSVQCLEAAQWNLEQAAQIFQVQKDNLPPDAFVPQ